MAPRDMVLVGHISGAHGIKGEVKLRSYTEDPQAIVAYSPLETAKGGKVEIVIERSGPDPKSGVDVTVRDFGPGIPDEHIPRITERFYRVDVEESRAQKGTGLGLAIVKHILSRHNARLTIRSRVGEGAAFTVHLPTA